ATRAHPAVIPGLLPPSSRASPDRHSERSRGISFVATTQRRDVSTGSTGRRQDGEKLYNRIQNESPGDAPPVATDRRGPRRGSTRAIARDDARRSDIHRASPDSDGVRDNSGSGRGSRPKAPLLTVLERLSHECPY